MRNKSEIQESAEQIKPLSSYNELNYQEHTKDFLLKRLDLRTVIANSRKMFPKGLAPVDPDDILHIEISVTTFNDAIYETNRLYVNIKMPRKNPPSSSWETIAKIGHANIDLFSQEEQPQANGITFEDSKIIVTVEEWNKLLRSSYY